MKCAGSIVGPHADFLEALGADEQGALAELLPDGVTESSRIPERFRQPFQAVEVLNQSLDFTFELMANGAWVQTSIHL